MCIYNIDPFKKKLPLLRDHKTSPQSCTVYILHICIYVYRSELMPFCYTPAVLGILHVILVVYLTLMLYIMKICLFFKKTKTFVYNAMCTVTVFRKTQ